MDLFHIIQDGVAILRLKGRVWKQTNIYRRGNRLYVPGAGGFVQLTRGGGTSVPNMTYEEVEGPGVTITNGIPMWVEPAPVKQSKLAVVSGS